MSIGLYGFHRTVKHVEISVGFVGKLHAFTHFEPCFYLNSTDMPRFGQSQFFIQNTFESGRQNVVQFSYEFHNSMKYVFVVFNLYLLVSLSSTLIQ